MTDDDSFRGEGIRGDFRLCRRDPPDKRGLPNIWKPCNNYCEDIFHGRQLSKDISYLVQEQKIIFYLVDDRGETGYGSFPGCSCILLGGVPDILGKASPVIL